MGGNVFAIDKSLFQRTVWRVWVCSLTFSMGALAHGIDSQMFGALQTLPSFLNTFGTTTNPTTGLRAFSTDELSQLNSVQWLGKFIGVIMFTWAVNLTGYKYGLVLAGAFQVVGAVLEMATSNWRVFIAGRTLIYLAMGIFENVDPLYMAEITPPQHRGFFLAWYPVFNSLGGIFVQGVIQSVKDRQDPSGWLIPCAVQFAPLVGIGLGWWFCPESPRYLMQKGKREEARKALASVRNAEDLAAGWVDLEMESIVQQIEIEKLKNGGTWADCFRGTNLRRTIVVIHMWVGNQWSGNQFMNSFAPTLYVLLGRRSQAYLYTIAYSVSGLISQVSSGLFIDKIGRRPIVIGGCGMMAVWLLLLAGMGTIPSPNVYQLNTMVASIVLFKVFLASSLQQMNHTLSAELPALQLRRKTNSIGTALDVIAAFAVTYSSPYLLTPRGANLGAKVGFIFGSFCVYFCLYSIFFVPEVKGRSLEEVDEMFEAKLWAWQFSKYQTKSIAGKVSAHDRGDAVKVDDDKLAETVDGKDLEANELDQVVTAEETKAMPAELK